MVPLLLGAGIYAGVLNLPFFWDDAANFNWMDLRPLSSIWTDATGFPYYRPLGFTLWRWLQLAAGPTTTPAFHTLDVLAHVLNAWLTGSLAGRFVTDVAGRRRLAATIAGALMIAFPFAASAVPHVAQDFHLYVTALVLGAIACAMRFRDSRRLRWAMGALTLAALAPFEHESGIAAGALVTLAIWVVPTQSVSSDAAHLQLHSRRAQVWLPALAMAANAAFIAWWLAVPKTRAGPFAWVGFESLAQSLVFFLQGLTFPVQFLARRLMSMFGWSDILSVALLVAAALVAAAWVLGSGSAGRRRALVFCLAYWLLAAAPSMIGLHFSYIIVSPRLQIFPSPASAVLWAIVVESLSRRVARRLRPVTSHGMASARSDGLGLNPVWVASILTVALLAAPVVHGLRIVRLHHYALDPVATLSQAARSQGSGRQLIVNAPNWIAPVVADYALGHEGVEIMPNYVSPQLLAWVNTRIRAPIDGVAFANVFPLLHSHYFAAWGEPQDWTSLAARVPEYDRIWLWQYSDSGSEMLEVGRARLAAPAPPQAYVAQFDGRVWLAAARVSLRHDQAEVRLLWSNVGPATEDVFAHVLDCSGDTLGQLDGAALGGTYPLWLWPPGVQVMDVRHVPLTRPPAAGCYRVAVGLFSPADGTRAPAFGSDGARLADDAVMLGP